MRYFIILKTGDTISHFAGFKIVILDNYSISRDIPLNYYKLILSFTKYIEDSIKIVNLYIFKYRYRFV